MTKHLSILLVVACLLVLGAPLLNKVDSGSEQMALPVKGGSGSGSPGAATLPVEPQAAVLFAPDGNDTFNPSAMLARRVIVPPRGASMSEAETLDFSQNVHVVGTLVCFTGVGRSTSASPSITSALRTYCIGSPEGLPLFRLAISFADQSELNVSMDTSGNLEVIDIPAVMENSSAGDEEEGQSAILSAPMPVCNPAACNPAGRTPIDVLVLYSPTVLNNLTAPGLFGQIAEAIEDTNQVFCNSEVNARLRIVGTAQTPSQSSSATVLRDDLVQVLAGNPRSTVPDNLISLREESGADLVLYFADTTTCGASPANSVLNTDKAAAVISLNSSCLPTLITRHKLANEISHLLGLDHALAVNGLAAETQAGTASTTYAHAYKDTYAGSTWGTVESDTANSIIPVFSSSQNSLEACGGAAVGHSTLADSVRALNATNIATVSGYKSRYAQEFVVLSPLDPNLHSACVSTPGDCYGGVPKPAFSTISVAAYHSICNIDDAYGRVDPSIGPNPLSAFPWSWPNYSSCTGKTRGVTNPDPGSANRRDLILVGPGTYVEHVGIAASSLSLKSILGPEHTTIKATQDGLLPETESAGSVYAFDLDGPGAPAQLRAVTNFWSAPGAAVNIRGFWYDNPNNSPSPLNTGNTAVYRPTVEGFTLRDGYGSRAAGGLWCQGEAAPTVKNNVFLDNHSWSGLGAALTFEGCGGSITGNIFRGNTIEQPAEKECACHDSTCLPYNWTHCSPMGCIEPTFRTADHKHWCYPWIQAGNTFCQAGQYCHNPYNIDLASLRAPAANTITGGAAMFVSPICRWHNADATDVTNYWGFDEERNDNGTYSPLCRNQSAVGRLEVSNNLIYENTYTNQLLATAPPTSGLRGAAVYLASPSTGAFSSLSINPAPLTVSLYHNTVSGNSFTGTNMSSALGAALSCFTSSGQWDSTNDDGSSVLRNNILAGNPLYTNQAINFQCSGWSSSSNVMGASGLSATSIFNTGSTNLDPYQARDPNFYYQLNSSGSGCNICERAHPAVDKAGCIEPASNSFDLAGKRRIEDLYALLDNSGCNASAAPDMGALEKQNSTSICCSNPGPGDKHAIPNIVPPEYEH